MLQRFPQVHSPVLKEMLHNTDNSFGNSKVLGFALLKTLELFEIQPRTRAKSE